MFDNYLIICANELCNKEFKGTKDRQYCSSKCAAIVNNKKYPKRPKRKTYICKCCKKPIKTLGKKYCSRSCQTIKEGEDKWQYFLTTPKEFQVATFSHVITKRKILEEQDNKCSICDIDSIWQDNKLVLILDHIDGNAANNARNNLRCICPNCDSQLDTYKSKNKKSARTTRYK